MVQCYFSDAPPLSFWRFWSTSLLTCSCWPLWPFRSSPSPSITLQDVTSTSAANSRSVSPNVFGSAGGGGHSGAPPFCRIVGGFGQLSLPQDRFSGPLSRGGSSESLSGSEHSSYTRGRLSNITGGRLLYYTENTLFLKLRKITEHFCIN